MLDTVRKNFCNNIIYTLLTLLLLFNCGCKKDRDSADSTDDIKFNDIKINDIKFNNILILGNSITKCPPIPGQGWHSTWGMAASSEDKDYVHLLEKKYKEINPAVIITPVNIADWEASHDKYDLAKLDQYLEKIPDLVIIRLGENVNDHNNFTNSLLKLINYVKSKSTETKFIITGLFWYTESIENQLKTTASANDILFIKIDLLNTPKNRSYFGAKVKNMNGSLYEIRDPGVVSHPGDIGMQKLAALLYNQLIGYSFK